MANNVYDKLYNFETIQVGDIVSLDIIQNKVRLSKDKFNNYDKSVIRYLYWCR